MTSNSQQLELQLPAPLLDQDTPLIPARMVNEFIYCPRLAYLMWTQGERVETSDVVEGLRVHKQVDKANKPLPAPEDIEKSLDEWSEDKIISRSLTLSSTKLGVIAKLDIAEVADGLVSPVDYKRGKRPHVSRGAYEPERVQVCLQAMLLEEHGYNVEEGVIYYAESKERVRVQIDEELRSETISAVNNLRLIVSQGRIPPPLKDSPKCPRCSLVSICLPDEVQTLSGSKLAPRPISVPVDDALPLIVQSQNARIGKSGETLKITEEDEKITTVRLIEISDVALFGNVSISTPALTALFEREIPVTFHSFGGWFRGIAQGLGHRNVEIRAAQYEMSFDKSACLRFSKDIVAAKITNQRTILRRNWKSEDEDRKHALNRLARLQKSTQYAKSVNQLLGIEGEAASIYFGFFSKMFKQQNDGSITDSFSFTSRNRRPPTDPVNAMLSYAYAMLTRHFTIALASVGFDPYRGFFHAPRFGRTSLALDIMEPFRPIIADSVVLTSINNGELSTKDFIVSTTGTALTQPGRRKFIQVFERRLSQEATHPTFGYQLSMRRQIILQARLLSRFLLGELKYYPHYLPR